MLGVNVTSSRILSQVPWKPRGYSSPLVSTHLNHNRAILLHSLASGHTCSYDLISCCSYSFLSNNVVGKVACSAGSISISRTTWCTESRLTRASLPSSSSTSSTITKNSTSPL
uniref:Uncharacterized protein n=1 Tax=Opuntia streptacantha TaxID=393608 RepID=A0A7C8Z1Q7_OPUST